MRERTIEREREGEISGKIERAREIERQKRNSGEGESRYQNDESKRRRREEESKSQQRRKTTRD